MTIVFNNHSFGNVLRDQQSQFGGRTIGSELENPDFMRAGRELRRCGERVHDPHALRGALERALASDGPALLEVVLDRGAETSPWDLIHMPTRPSLRAHA